MIANLQYLADQTSAEGTNQEKRMRSEKAQLTWVRYRRRLLIALTHTTPAFWLGPGSLGQVPGGWHALG